MKKAIFTLLIIVTTITNYAQAIGYDSFGLLLSNEDLNGTARFTAMSGAFGALGGNMSSAEVNPAGLAVFKHSQASISLQNIHTQVDANYFNSLTSVTNDNLNISQAGGVLIFENGSNYWNKMALGVNYSLTKDFDNSYLVEGNSGLSEFYIDPYLNFDNDDTNDVFYDNVEKQTFLNSTTGTNTRGTFTLAFAYDKTISYGVSMLFNSVNYFQHTNFKESNYDNANNTLHAELNQNLSTYGDGIGFNFGILAKPNKNIRLGLAYQTPIWYKLTEEFNESTKIHLSNTNDVFTDNPDDSTFDYKIKTTSKATGSFAYIFGKQGLLSLDYIRKAYNNIKLKPVAEFSGENDAIKQDLRATNEIRIGGEYRYKNLSLRAGYRMEENPIKAITTNTNGYSLGLGIGLSGNTKLDFSYSNTSNKDMYSFLQKNDIQLNNNQSKINATLTIGLE